MYYQNDELKAYPCDTAHVWRDKTQHDTTHHNFLRPVTFAGDASNYFAEHHDAIRKSETVSIFNTYIDLLVIM